MRVMRGMSVYIEQLIEFEKLGITNATIMRYCGIKDRDTITSWWKGGLPLVKNRVKLTRLLLIAREGRETPPTTREVWHSFEAYAKSPEFIYNDEMKETFQRLILAVREGETLDHTIKISGMTNAKLCEKFHPNFRVRRYFEEYNALI